MVGSGSSARRPEGIRGTLVPGRIAWSARIELIMITLGLLIMVRTVARDREIRRVVTAGGR